MFTTANFTVRAQKFDPSNYTMYSQAIEFLMDDHDDCNCNNLFVEKDLFSVSYSCLTSFSDESEITGGNAYLFVFDQNKKLKNVIYGDGYTF